MNSENISTADYHQQLIQARTIRNRCSTPPPLLFLPIHFGDDVRAQFLFLYSAAAYQIGRTATDDFDSCRAGMYRSAMGYYSLVCLDRVVTAALCACGRNLRAGIQVLCNVCASRSFL